MTTIVVYPRVEVTADGEGLTVMGASTVASLRNPVSTANVTVRHDESDFDGTEEIAVAFGDQSGVIQNFSGILETDSMTYAPGVATFAAMGLLSRTQEATGIVDETATPITDPLDPPYQGPTFAKMWMNATDGEIITDILGLYGLTNISIDDSGTVFGTLDPVYLRSDQPGWSLIEELDIITGRKTFIAPDGVITRIEFSGLPGPSGSYTFVEGLNIRQISRERSTGKVYNIVVVNGLAGIQTSSGEYYDISASRVATSPYIPDPPGTRQYTFTSALIETEELAGDCAARLLAQLNRRTENISATITPGNKFLRPGMTIAITAPSVGLDSTYVSKLIEVRQNYGKDYVSQIILEGALAGEGTDPNMSPVASISYSIEQEMTETGPIWVVALDGSASYDPDGFIVDYAWSASTGVLTPFGIGKTASLIIVTGIWPTPEPTVTLQVTDDHGKINSKTITIMKTVKNTFVRDLWAAVTTKLLVSLDGQTTWVTIDIAATVLPEEAGNLYQLAADGSGVLYRVLLDATFTLPTGPSGVTALFITRDRVGVETGVAWAGTSTGAIWRSIDYGVTWALQGTIAGGNAIHAITESPYSSGDMYALAGRSIQHSYDAGVTWTQMYIHPNTGVFANRWASGITAEDQAIHWAAFFGPDVTADASHLIELENTIDIDTATPADKPLRFTGATLSLDSERILLTDISLTGDGRAWSADATVSGNLSPMLGYSDAVLGLPAHIRRDGKYPVIWGISDNQIWKALDEMVTFATIKTLTGGQVGMMISYGKLHPPVVLTGNLCFLARRPSGLPDECVLIVLTDTGWVNRGDVGLSGGNFEGTQRHRLIRTLDGTLLAWHYQRDGVGSYGVRRSTDTGLTWADVTDLTDALDIVQADNGTLYAYGNRYTSSGTRARIMISADDGVTWTEVANYLFHNGGSAEYVRLGVDPADDQHLILKHISGVALSTDGGATFGSVIGPGGMGGNGDADWAIATPSANRYAHWATGIGGSNLGGGTISPLTNVALSGTITAMNFSEWQKIDDLVSYAFSQNLSQVYKTVDGGVSWATAPLSGTFSDVAQDSETEDIYLTWEGASGSGTLIDPWTGAVRKLVGGIGSPVDLTQNLADTLGDLYVPYHYAAVI